MLFSFIAKRSFRVLPVVGLAAVLTSAGGAIAQDSLLSDEAPAESRAPLTREELAAEFQRVVTDGQQQYVAGDFQAAVQSFDRAVQLTQGTRPDTLLLRAKALFKIEEYEAALEDIREMLSVIAGADSPFEAEARSLRAEIYLETGSDIPAAFTDAEFAVKKNRNNPQYQFLYGKAGALTGQATLAVKALTRYLAADDQNPEAFRLRGQANLGLGKFEPALADIQSAIQIDPADHETYMALAQVHLAQQDYKATAEALREALNNYEPADPDLPVPLAQAHLLRASAMEEIGKQIILEGPDAAAAKDYFLEGKRECETLLETLPDNPGVLAIRASALFRLGIAERLLESYPAAVKAFSDALNINPALGEAYFRRGICYYHMNEPRLALDDFEQGAAINFDNPRSNLWRGRCHNQLKQYREAIKSFSAAVAVSDTYTTAYEHRGLVYLQLGEFEKAMQDFNKTIRLEPAVGWYHFLRGVAFEQLGETDKAINSYTNAIENDSELVDSYDALADLLSRSGRRRLGEQYRRQADELRNKQSAAAAEGSAGR